jgi:tRNA(Ile)-lysidine synthase
MNFFKGTGISGLRGILPKKGKLVRPLLFASKEEILLFAKENDLSYVEDSSNISDKYTRNYFRNQLIPSLEKVFPAIRENLSNSIDRFREVEMLYLQTIHQHKKKLLEYKGDEVHIPVLKLKKSIPVETILYEIIKDYGFTSHQVKDVLNIADSESGKFVASPTHRIIKNRNWFVISSNKMEKSGFITIEENDKKINFLSGSLIVETLSASQPLVTDQHIAQLDANEIKFPLLLRKWKQGDYFYPLGMKKKKKLSRFFIDQKLSLTEKENVWVIEMNKKIVWIVGKRIDDRFKITDKTTNILKIHFQ